MHSHCVDLSVVHELRQLSDHTDPSFLWKQVMAFSERAQKMLSTIEEGLQRNDPSKVRSAAHALAGSAALVGAVRLYEISQDLERHCDRFRYMHAEMLYELLCEEYPQVQQILMGEVSDVFIDVQRVS